MGKIGLLLRGAITVLVVSGCTLAPDAAIHDSFYLRSNGVDMPVWICGDMSSDVALVYVNGGPGATSAGYWNTASFTAFGAHYTTVFYDQRSAGFTLGNPDTATLDVEECAKDLDMLVDYLRITYPAKKIFLMGVSWGGLLGTVYLTDTARQAKIRGWIEIDGGHNFRLGVRTSCAWVVSYAQQAIADPTLSQADKAAWQAAIDWYGQHPVDSWQIAFGVYPTDWITHVGYVNKANGYAPVGKIDVFMAEVDKMSRYGPYTGLYSSGSLRWYSKPLWELDATPKMGNITIPSLITWGNKDGILPVALAQNAYDNLGTAPAQKSIVYFPESGHMPILDASADFIPAVETFVAAYK